MKEKKKKSMLQKWVSIAFVFPSNFEFFWIHFSRNTNTAYTKIVKNHSECLQENSRERKKKSHGEEVCFHCFYLPYRISRIFFAFINLQILMGRIKKKSGIFLHAHRKNLVKKKIQGGEVCFHCSCLPSQISSFFLHS